MATKAHLEGNKRHLEKLDDIKVRVPKGQRERYQTYASTNGESLNGFIIRAMNETMERDALNKQAENIREGF